MDKEKKVRSKEEILLKSFPHLGTRFDTIDDVIAELGEFGYGCVLAAMEEYASQLTPSSREEELQLFIQGRIRDTYQVIESGWGEAYPWDGHSREGHEGMHRAYCDVIRFLNSQKVTPK